MQRTFFRLIPILVVAASIALPVDSVLADPLPTGGAAQKSCSFRCAPSAAPGGTQVTPQIIVPCTTDRDCVSACTTRCASPGPQGNGLAAATGTGYVCSQTFTPTCVDPSRPAAPSTNSAAAQGAGTVVELPNPLGNVTDPVIVLGRVIRSIFGILGALALMWCVWGGILWMTAAESKRTQEAQTIIKNAALGIVLLFFSYSLATAFLGIFQEAASRSAGTGGRTGASTRTTPATRTTRP